MTLRLACRRGRAQLVVGEDDFLVDLEQASRGEFSPDPIEAYRRWDELREFAATVTDGGEPVNVDDLDAPSPRPAQVFGIGLNYRRHAAETGATVPSTPLTFTKFPTSIGGPNVHIPLVGTTVDWEVELVVVVASGGRDIDTADAWDALAGVCVGQDVSDRTLQNATVPAQFNLGKSRRNYAPFGPWVTDSRGLEGRDSLELVCTLNGSEVQHETTDDLIFGVPEIVSYLSGIVELCPGDVIFTGTPSGVGAARRPPVFLRPGDVIDSSLVGHARMTNRCV